MINAVMCEGKTVLASASHDLGRFSVMCLGMWRSKSPREEFIFWIYTHKLQLVLVFQSWFFTRIYSFHLKYNRFLDTFVYFPWTSDVRDKRCSLSTMPHSLHQQTELAHTVLLNTTESWLHIFVRCTPCFMVLQKQTIENNICQHLWSVCFTWMQSYTALSKVG